MFASTNIKSCRLHRRYVNNFNKRMHELYDRIVIYDLGTVAMVTRIRIFPIQLKGTLFGLDDLTPNGYMSQC